MSDVLELSATRRDAMALLRASGLGQDPFGGADVDRTRLRRPDVDAVKLVRLVPDDDESTAVELLIAAGYDYEYGAAILALYPPFAPDAEGTALVRRLLAEAGLPETPADAL
ncbi:hypothetical protein AGRA3207_007470 [Actinomadura graeca]|uniref:Uncharacterized protein n=1 Tax=Actinomadura graeca TaxID=2750812 RepID=A0ABX8R5U3_9ACTN|nr:hypothetical protein [Actinomadura graeca]QXJ25901.1 hypothetical protein AGRA3207_007470 [Actinomadura graeca]